VPTGRSRGAEFQFGGQFLKALPRHFIGVPGQLPGLENPHFELHTLVLVSVRHFNPRS
jgi:hypothetical protein